MTREEIRLTLEAIEAEGSPSGGPPSSTSSARLAAILLEQERRLADLDRRMRVLEPCTVRPHHRPHLWTDAGADGGQPPSPEPSRCTACGVSR